MLIKLTSGLQTRNYLGISPEDLGRMNIDKHYNYIRTPGYTFEAEKKGQVITLEGLPLNVHRDYIAVVSPNPELFKHGVVWGQTVYGGECLPTVYLKAHKAEEIELEYLYEVRLIK